MLISIKHDFLLITKKIPSKKKQSFTIAKLGFRKIQTIAHPQNHSRKNFVPHGMP